MATAWVREFTELGKQLVGPAPQIAKEAGTDQTPVTFTTTTQSAAFGANTKYIEMYGSAAFHYVVGTNPTATTNAMKVAADSSKYIGVNAGEKIAFILAV